jgi:hypothetical protein
VWYIYTHEHKSTRKRDPHSKTDTLIALISAQPIPYYHLLSVTMPAIANPSLIFNELPKGEPTLDTLKLDQSAEIDLDAELNENEIVLKLVSVSLDPYMRGRMRHESIKSYSPPFSLHKP